MRFVTARLKNRSTWGIIDGDSVLLAPADDELPTTLLDVVTLGRGAAVALGARLADGLGDRRSLTEGKLLAPIPQPRKNILCLGLNYAAHAEESLRSKGREVVLPEHPVVFTKAVTSVTGPYSDVVLDPAVTAQADWEVELGVVLGRTARHVSPATALDHVFGYTVVNDLSARDLQFRHKQFFIGKSVDGFCPMGPWIVTADEIPDPQALGLECRVNGVAKQSGHTGDQIFGVADVIHRISQSMTLEPGDVIATGTPDGVGFARQPPEFLAPGDVVECEIEGIGTIRNRMVAPHPSDLET